MNDTPQRQGPYGEYDYMEQKKKNERRRRTGLIAAVSVIVFLFVGVVSAFVWLNRYSERPAAPPSSSQQSSGGQSQAPQQPSQSSQGSSEPELLDDAPEVIITEGAAEPSLTVSEIYKKVSPSVVMILADGEGGTGLGTVIIMSEDGYIITNAHVIHNATKITIIMNDNTVSYEAAVRGRDNNSDIAVLKVDANGLTPAVFGDSDKVEVGDPVVSIGNPYSVQYAQTVTDGIISGIRQGVYVNNRKLDLLQTNAQLNPGNSGGPLINEYGQVIGINNSKIMSDGVATYEGMGFAIPMTQAKVIIDELIATGKVEGQPIIGVTVAQVTQEMAEQEGVVPGARVVSIDTSSDAYSRGMRLGDIITQINGKTFEDVDDFVEEKNRFKIGDQISLTYWREGKTYEIQVRLMEDISSY